MLKEFGVHKLRVKKSGSINMSVAKIVAGGSLADDIRQAVSSLGGIGKFVEAGDKVLLKPNFNTSDPFPASSDVAFIAAVADICREAGAAEVIVGDSCTYFLKTEKVMKECGAGRLPEGRPWLRLMNFDAGKWVARPVPGGRFLKSVLMPAVLEEADKVILLPCLKTHIYAAYTGALKLAVGLMKPSERMSLHMNRLQEKIGELNAAYRPDLVIMDARKCFIAGGPAGGELREPGLILASTDRVAVDIEGVRIIQGFPGNSLAGVEAAELPQIAAALRMGAT